MNKVGAPVGDKPIIDTDWSLTMVDFNLTGDPNYNKNTPIPPDHRKELIFARTRFKTEEIYEKYVGSAEHLIRGQLGLCNYTHYCGQKLNPNDIADALRAKRDLPCPCGAPNCWALKFEIMEVKDGK